MPMPSCSASGPASSSTSRALREQLAEAVAVIEEIGDVVKRQASQITRLRADLKKATPPVTPAAAKKPAAKKPAAKAPAKRTSRSKPDSTA